MPEAPKLLWRIQKRWRESGAEEDPPVVILGLSNNAIQPDIPSLSQVFSEPLEQAEMFTSILQWDAGKNWVIFLLYRKQSVSIY